MSGTQVDAEDFSGKFGYETLDVKQHIPYIIRGGEKVCATKIFQWHVDKLNIKLNPALAQFPYLMGHVMNRNETALYNEINFWHNNGMYPFTFRASDTLVKLCDVCDIFKFVQDCDKKIKVGEQHEMDAGLIQIKCTAPGDTDDEPSDLYTVWPYISKDKKRYVPIAFLTDSSSTLSATIVLEGIDVMYMRYLYTVLKCEIPKPNFDMPCVELDDALAQTLSATDVTYEYDANYWPSKKRLPPLKATPLSVLLGSHIKKLNNNNLAFFTRPPTNMDRVEKVPDVETTTPTTTETTTTATPTETKSSESESDISDANTEDKENQKISSRKRPAENEPTRKENDRKKKASSHYFAVEDLIDFKMVRGKEMVLVRWKGYQPEDDTWEPVTNMNKDLEDDVDKLREKYREKARRNKKHYR